MTKQEAIEIIRMAIAQIEWEYPMDYAVAFDMAIEALNQPEIVRCKECKHQIDRGRKYKECDKHFLWANDDWFCADGERKE